METKFEQDPAELKLKAHIDELLRIRRQFLKVDANRAKVKAAGNRVFDAFTREFRKSLKPAKAKKA